MRVESIRKTIFVLQSSHTRWQSCYKIISVERLSCAALSRGSQLKASAANGENFEVRLTRPVFGADVVVVTTVEPLLLRIAVTADNDCIDGC